MSRRLRSGKGLTQNEVLAHREALRAGTANTSGLPALPPELLFEIISHFPTVPLPLGGHDHDRRTAYPAPYLERHRTLRVLSQMCRSFRRIFLPYVWEKIEVWATSRVPHHRDVPDTAAARRSRKKLVNKELATELVTQLEIVTIRDPTLAQRVKYVFSFHSQSDICSTLTNKRIVNVLLTGFSAGTVVSELVRCLALFPNLHTLQIFGDSWWVTSCVAIALEGKLFPSVRTVSMNLNDVAALKSFPEVRDVSITSYSPSIATYIISSPWPQNCQAIEVLRGFEDIDYGDILVGCQF